MFSGRSEGGPRALGNRSILFDPRNPNGKNIVNRVKGREWFRPFAGSVLEEHASEWFDLRTLKSSPFMMYAVNVLPSKLNEIPAVTHVDGTCRVQTVNQEDTAHYYTLIKSFYEKTNIPVIFNTSFNLAGEPLVDNLFDAANTILRSDIKYLYLPDIGKMLVKD
jgi:carbamoyltransferase